MEHRQNAGGHGHIPRRFSQHGGAGGGEPFSRRPGVRHGDGSLEALELQEGKYKLLDGNHRLYKALALQVDRLLVYVLAREEHIRYIENYQEETYRKIMEDLFGRDR